MNIYDQLEQRRKQVLGKNYTPIPTGTGSTAPGSVESFQARRQQILSQGSQVAQTPVKKISASAPLTVQPKSLIQQAEGAVGAAVNTVSNVLRLNPKQKTVPLTQIPHSTDLNTNPVNSPSAQMTVTPQSLQSQQKAQKLGDKAVAVQNRFRDTYLEMQNQVGDALKDFRPLGAPAYAPANENQPGNIKDLQARDKRALTTGVTPERVNKDLGIFTLKLVDGASFGVLSAMSNGAPEKNAQMTPEGKKVGGVADVAGQLAFISPQNLLKFVAVSKTFDAGFSKITGKQSLADFVPENNQTGKIVANAIEFLGKAFITHKLNGDTFKNAREVLTKNIMTEYKMPESIRITPEGVQNVAKGLDTSVNKDALAKLGMTSSEWRTASKNGVSIDIPAEKVVTITDKPLWAKMKSYLSLPADERTIVISGTRGNITGFGGYLDSGENKPQDVVNAVIKAGQENTPVGKEAIRKAMTAQKDGTTLNVVNSTDSKDIMSLEKNIQEYRSFGGYTQGTQTENAALRDIASITNKPDVQKYTQEKVSKAIDEGKMNLNDNGTVTLYRGGEPSKTDNLMSATYDKSVAQTFADNAGIPVTEIKVKPEDIKAFIGKAEGEVLLANPKTASESTTLYHGTTDKFDKFDSGKMVDGNLGKGIYLTDNVQSAKYYSRLADQGKQLKTGSLDINPQVKHVLNVEVKKDAKITTLDHMPTKAEVEQIKASGYDGIRYPDETFKNNQDWNTKVLGEYPKNPQAVMLFNSDSAIVKNAVEPNSNYIKRFHQTSPENALKIQKEGFSNKNKVSGATDVLPNGINTKPTEENIMVQGQGANIEYYVPKNAKIKVFKDRFDAENYFKSKSEEYRNILEKIDKLDREVAKKANGFLDHKATSREDGRRYLKMAEKELHLGRLETMLEADKARKIADKIMKDEGIDVVHIKHDKGSFGATDNMIILDPKFAKTKDQLTNLDKPMTPVKDVIEKKQTELQRKQEIKRQQAIIDNKPKVEKKVLTGKEVSSIREVISAKIETLKGRVEKPEEYQKGINDLIQYVEGKAGNDKQVLSALRTELNKEMYGIAGAGGNYKQAYAIIQTMKDNPDVGGAINTLEDAISRVDDKLLTAKEVKPTEKAPIAEKVTVQKGVSQGGQTPVGTGKMKDSRAFKRFVDQLQEADPQRYEILKGDKVTYNTLNLEKDAEAAMKLIEQDPEKAYRIAKGIEAPPDGQTETAISIALANRAEKEGNFTTQADLEVSRSLRQTRRGQEIVSERGRFNDNSPHRFIQELLDRRLSNAGKNFVTKFSEDVLNNKMSPKKAAVKQIDQEVKRVKEVIQKKKKTTLQEDLQTFINDLICK